MSSAKTTTRNCGFKVTQEQSRRWESHLAGCHLTWTHRQLVSTWSQILGAQAPNGNSLHPETDPSPREAQETKHSTAHNAYLFQTVQRGRESGKGTKTTGPTRDEFQLNDTHVTTVQKSKNVSAPEK